MVGGVMGVSQMSGVSGILPYHAYQHGASARTRAVYGNMYGRSGQNTSVTASASGIQNGTGGAAVSLSGTQAGRKADPASSVSGVQRSGVVTAGRAASPETPVEPVNLVNVVGSKTAGSSAIPFMREGMDPAELAVRMRIQYMDPAQEGREAGMPEDASVENLPGEAGKKANAVQKASDEGECQTCKERKYQDGSDDSGVSYQTPTHIDPDQAASAVRGHEMEHVVRERASAEREDRRVVSQSVTMHTAICPECGKVYVSGGTTRTTTASDPKPEMPEQQPKEGFSAAA